MMISGSYPPMKCGVGSYTKRLAETVAGLPDVEVAVLTDRRAMDFDRNTKVEVMPVMVGWRLRHALRGLFRILKWRPDVVHIQYPTLGYMGNSLALHFPLILRMLGIPCVQTWHESTLFHSHEYRLTYGLNALISVRKGVREALTQRTREAIADTPFFWIPNASLLPGVTLTEARQKVIRQRYVLEGELLLVYYGFVAPLKGLESLLEVTARMANVRLVLACDLNPADDYQQSLLDKIGESGIASRVVRAGFMPDTELAETMAAADAVVLPFRDGGGYWNTSIDGAIAQGVFVLTTSVEKQGYEADTNVFCVRPGDVDGMVAALKTHAGVHIKTDSSQSKWAEIARQHLDVYKLSLAK